MLLLAILLGFMFIGVPVAFAFLAANLVGAFVFMSGEMGLKLVAANAAGAVTSFALAPVPLFILMGELFFHTGLAVRVFGALDRCFGNVPGRLSYVTVGGGTIFAALSGSSLANTAMMGTLMVPEMERRGYKRYISIGPVLGTGGLAMLIPPSGLAVLFGSIARVDIGALLIAGLLPGLILAAMYVVVIYTMVRIDPAAAPPYEGQQATFFEKATSILVNVLPLGLVVFCVIGLILLGIATPTEAAAFGVLAVLLIAVPFRCLTVGAVRKSLRGTAKITGMIFLIVIGSSTFSQILAFSGASSGVLQWATSIELSKLETVFLMFGLVLILGMFMEQVSIMLLTVPIFMPLAASLGLDPVWFGLIMLLGIEIGFTTPPFGLLLFVIMGTVKGTTLPEVSLAALPFIFCVLILFLLVVAFPEVFLLLPRLVSQ